MVDPEIEHDSLNDSPKQFILFVVSNLGNNKQYVKLIDYFLIKQNLNNSVLPH